MTQLDLFPTPLSDWEVFGEWLEVELDTGEEVIAFKPHDQFKEHRRFLVTFKSIILRGRQIP